MLAETLLTKVIEASLGMLADFGLNKAADLRDWLLKAPQPRQRAFESAWKEAAKTVDDPEARSLLEHRPFQEQVALGLLDPINGFDLRAAAKDWQGSLPQHARTLRSFFDDLQNILLADEAWGEILPRYQTLRFEEEVLKELRQRKLPEDDRQLVQYISQRVQGDVVTGGEKHNLEVGDVYGHYVNIADRVEQTLAPGGAVAPNNQGLLVQIVQNFVRDHPAVSEESIQRQVRQYVNWLDENFKDIVVKGIKRKDSEIVHLPLELVFAPLEGEYQEAPGAAPQAGKRASRRQALEEQEKRSVVIPLHRALSLGNRIVITGGPGCGKSTVLIYLAWKLAHAWKSGNENEVRALLGLEGALPLREGKIAAVGPSAALQDQYPQEERLDASGRVVLPGFVDAHTHALWAGDRAAEFEMRLEGKTYLEIWPPAGASFRQ